MVQVVDEGFDRFFYVAVVDEIALVWINLAGDHDFDTEGVSVDSAAFVPLGKGRQPMGRVK